MNNISFGRSRRNRLLLLIFMILTLPGWSQAKDTGWISLGSLDNWNPEVLRFMPERFLILGEIHGTEESPRAALGLARSLKGEGQMSVLAIEWPSYLSDDITKARWEELKSQEFFKAGDGRTSHAMVDTICQALAEGIPVLCFDQLVTDANEREKACARALLEISKGHPGAKVVVLVGNHHSRIQGENDAPSMAMHLKAEGAEVLTLRLTAQEGDAWVWTKFGRGPQTIANPLTGTKAPAFRRFSQLEADHEARVHLESCTASRPWADELVVLSEESEFVKDNEELKALFADDQAPRLGDRSKIDWGKLRLEDQARRARVHKMLEARAVRTGRDFWHAAFIFQHGDKPDDFLLAHALACASLARGYTESAWIAAASLDRYLGNIGRPQVYGTQYKKNIDGTWGQGDFNKTLLSDYLRDISGVETLSEQAFKLREMQARKGN